MAYTGGEALVQVLKQQGVKAIFSSPGTEWAPVWEALAKTHAQGDKEPRYYNCRHEMLATSMAVGYARKGLGLPVVLLHTSAGLLHGAMAIRGANIDQVPMLVCCGETARFTESDDLERGVGWRWLHFLSDVGGSARMAASFVKWSQAVTSRETLSGSVARACHLANMDPPGPVFLSISKEFLQEQIEETLPHISPPRADSLASPGDIETIASLLLQSQNPVIITERIGAEPQAALKLLELVDTLAIPVFEAMGQECANFPKGHALHAGFDPGQAIRDADLVLAVAASTPWNPQAVSPNPEAKVVFLDKQAPYPQFPYWNYRADMIVAADPLPTLEALLTAVKARIKGKPILATRSARLDSWKAKHDRLFASWDNHALQNRQKKPIDPHWLCYAINESLPENTIVVEETITHTPAINRLLRRVKPGNMYKGHVGGLGSGMGVALGIKLASLGQPVIHLVGDGSFNYNPVLAGLGFAQEYKQPVLTVVFNNGAYRAMESTLFKLYPEGWASRTRTIYGVDIAPSPDYAQLMKAFDGYGEKVEDPDEIKHALGRAWAEVHKGRSALLDVILDPRDPRR